MSLKHLARTLEKLSCFKNPKIELEQYSTNADVASELLWSAYMNGLIKNKAIMDLGAGTGILGIGALLLGAKKVVFLEKDEEAIKILEKNLLKLNEKYELPSHEIIMQDISYHNNKYDLVITNPPFGTKIKRMDTIFLQKAFSLSNNIISIHKTSTKDYIKNLFKENNYQIIDIFDFEYSLKKTFEHHEKKVKKIFVSGFLTKKSN